MIKSRFKIYFRCLKKSYSTSWPGHNPNTKNNLFSRELSVIAANIIWVMVWNGSLYSKNTHLTNWFVTQLSLKVVDWKDNSIVFLRSLGFVISTFWLEYKSNSSDYYTMDRFLGRKHLIYDTKCVVFYIFRDT